MAKGKGLGGTSILNAMIYIKGNKRDYDTWEKLGNTGWGWDTVKEHFKNLENMQAEGVSDEYGRGGYMTLNRYPSDQPIASAIIEAFKEMRLPLLNEENPANPLGVLTGFQCIKDGIRFNTGRAFLGQVKSRSNLMTALHSFVQKVNINRKSKSATGVQVNVRGTIINVKAKKEVIVSGGTVNSPQLLMLSGIGPKNHLEKVNVDPIKDLPVGEHLEDHTLHAGFFVKVNPEIQLIDNQLDTIYKYFAHQEGKLGTLMITNIMASAFPSVMGLKNEILANINDAIEKKSVLGITSTVLNPKSQGKILLKTSNANDKPLIYSGYLSDQNGEDMAIMLESLRFLENLIETSSLKKYDPQIMQLNLPECDKFEFRSDDYWKCSIRYLTTTIFHPTGTCKMGPSDDGTAVVDLELRVFGIDNLRVADASIMPNINKTDKTPRDTARTRRRKRNVRESKENTFGKSVSRVMTKGGTAKKRILVQKSPPDSTTEAIKKAVVEAAGKEQASDIVRAWTEGRGDAKGMKSAMIDVDEDAVEKVEKVYEKDTSGLYILSNGGSKGKDTQM
ncbi:unnamed protein product [Diabrotica balteata]|uniref:Glucose-methanol-choline oxidoreductase N-terminal domain-containing protein n=1 Tax=Diabrotica balteata TaxID=107213 RepID=A0A9N9SUI7_DIABA|nr:unnamed protein product [Diabrotica balteata]